jgi:hypothetical protein
LIAAAGRLREEIANKALVEWRAIVISKYRGARKQTDPKEPQKYYNGSVGL